MEEEKKVEEIHEIPEVHINTESHQEDSLNNAVSKDKKNNLTEKVRKNPWIISTIILGIITLILLALTFFGGITGKVISSESAAQKIIDYYEANGITGLTLESISEVSGLYEVKINYEDEVLPFYITKDGKSFTSYLISIDEEETESTSNTESSKQENIPKTEKPSVELFVMSYCPYGTQAEKGIIPVVELLKDKIDFKLRFVDYAMHDEKEIQENLREYCIQKEQSNKLITYMRCFLEGDGVESNGYITNGNDVNTCLSKAGIDKTKLDSCMENSDEEFSVTENFEDKSSWLSGRYPMFNVDKELNEEYGIAGSPSLVINGVEASSSRDPASYLKIICSAFTNAPEECEESLSSSTPSAYFGWNSSQASTSASCG